MMKRVVYIVMIITIFVIGSCKKDRGVNIFTKKQDVQLGLQLKDQIMASDDFIVVDPNQDEASYAFLNRIMNNILDSASDITNGRDVFNWEVNIIKNDDVLNAFACPGGYMFFYTGLMKFLEDESQLAGVMAHEMAHVELRHSTRQMTQTYSIQILLDVVAGKSSSYKDTIFKAITGGLAALAFSRKHEYQADEYAVKFLSDTRYYPLGVAGFFELLEAEGKTSGRLPTFLSTHPDPGNRITAIKEVWSEEGSNDGNTYEQRYQEFKQNLP